MSALKLNPFLRDALRQLTRSGRWGTCAGCPRDQEGHVYPEFCEFTKRYDHDIGLDALVEQIKRAQK